MADQPAATTQVPAEQVSPDLSAESMMKDDFLLLGVIFFIFYFLLIRPHQKRLNVQKEMMKSLAKGNKVISSGGIIGTIVKFEGDDIVVVEIAPGVKVRKAKSAITEVLDDKAAPGASANDN